MNGYTKLFNSILGSTIWDADNATRILWITMLASADKHGTVSASVPGLANFSRLSISDVQSGLEKLMAPDEHSRTKEHEGRRVKEVNGGWVILNYLKYRNMLSAEERREYKRIKQNEYREKWNAMSTSSTNSTSGQCGHIAEAEAEAEAKASKDVGKFNLEIEPSSTSKRNSKKSTNQTAEQIITELAAMDCYKGIDVAREYGKMVAWCEANGKQPTKRRLINWLNRVDKPLNGSQTTKPTLTVHALQRLIDDKRQQIAKHRGQHFYDEQHMQHWDSPSSRDAYREMKRDLDSLNSKLDQLVKNSDGQSQ